MNIPVSIVEAITSTFNIIPVKAGSRKLFFAFKYPLITEEYRNVKIDRALILVKLAAIWRDFPLRFGEKIFAI